MANRFDIRVENPGARQDWAMKPSLNSDCKPIVLDSEPAAGSEKSSHQTNNSISSFIPRWNIKEIGFIVIEQQLNDNASILTIILQTCFVIRIFINQHWRQHLDSNDPHNVGGVLSVRILGIFICQDCHRICPVNLEEDANHILMYHTCNSVLERIVKFDRISNTEYIRILKMHRILNTEYIRFLKNDRIRIPNSAIRT